jgi:hypothetical protein
MPKTQKSLFLRNLAKYDVYIEDRDIYSQYFRVSNLPQVFTGGRNSFLLGATAALKPNSTILVELLDVKGNTIFQQAITGYVEGTSRLLSVEIYSDTPPGVATLIILGEAQTTANGDAIPATWTGKYNVRWARNILVDSTAKNISPLRFINTPQLTVEENRFYNVGTSSFATTGSNLTASLSPMLMAGTQIGYLVSAVSPTSFSADYYNSSLTGMLRVNGSSASISLPITDILNSTTAFSTGSLLSVPAYQNIDRLMIYSGSYSGSVSNTAVPITTTVRLAYSKLSTQGTNIPISYAKLRVSNLTTVSGEIFKVKVYNKIATALSDYKVIADTPVLTSELLVSSSIYGDTPIGDFNLNSTASNNWYADIPIYTTNVTYPISGSPAYYTSSVSGTPISLYTNNSVLLSSMYANVPMSSSNVQYNGSIATSGYFIGTKNPITLYQTSEYTLSVNAYYKSTSGSANLLGNAASVDIYLVGTNGTTVIDKNPLGQKIGTLQATITSPTSSQWFENTQFNFYPSVITSGSVGVRFVVSNGFWNFSNVSVTPATDLIFSPDEAEFLIPNTIYNNELLEYKMEFFDINNNSADIAPVSVPTYFTGSVIDLGILR